MFASALGMVRRPATTAALIALTIFLPKSALAQTDLLRARQLYNTGKYDEAIAAAEAARSRPKGAASAGLIVARCRLERFRASGDQQELGNARKELIAVESAGLSDIEAIEWNMGVAEALVFEHQPGPAAEIFGALITTAHTKLPAGEMEKLIEWWASTSVAVADSLPEPARIAKYESILADLDAASADRPSRAALYWSVVALRGTGDFDAAWNAAVASWIRAHSMTGTEQLRKDLARFVLETLIPERAQARTGERLDVRTTISEISALTEEWRGLTARWGQSD